MLCVLSATAAISSAQTPEVAYTVLYNFTGGADEGAPNAVIRDTEGNLYGTTYGGGSTVRGCGTVFKLSPTGT